MRGRAHLLAVDAKGALQERVLGAENGLADLLGGRASKAANGVPSALDSAIHVRCAHLAEEDVELGRARLLELLVLARRLRSQMHRQTAHAAVHACCQGAPTPSLILPRLPWLAARSHVGAHKAVQREG